MQSGADRWQRALYMPLAILAWLAVLVVVGWLLGYVTKTILMIALAGVLAFALAPLAKFLARWLPELVAIGLAYALGIAVVVGLGAFIVATVTGQITSLVTNLPIYAQQTQAYEPRLLDWLGPFGITPDAVNGAEAQVIGELESLGTGVARESVSRLAALVSGLIDAVLILILSVYFAANGPELVNWLQNEVPADRRRHVRFFVTVVNRVIGGYVRGTFTLAALIGLMVGIGLWLFGVPYAAMLGVLAFFMEFIPVLGVFITGTAAVLLALFQGWQLALFVLGYFVLAHVLEADVIGPRILGKAIGIHPAIGLVAFLAGTELFGIWGALFAAPVAGLIQAAVTAGWLELRSGAPSEVVDAVVDRQQEKLEAGIRAVSPAPEPPASVSDSAPRPRPDEAAPPEPADADTDTARHRAADVAR
jgi:predicted PurR-regulated permease PerM